MKQITLTGIKPTGQPHIGNYLGMIKPALELAETYQALYFIADYHALTTVKDKKELIYLTHQATATWLALGLNPDEVIFYRQSDIPEVFELSRGRWRVSQQRAYSTEHTPIKQLSMITSPKVAKRIKTLM